MEVKFNHVEAGIEKAIKPPIYLYRVADRLFTTLSEARMVMAQAMEDAQ